MAKVFVHIKYPIIPDSNDRSFSFGKQPESPQDLTKHAFRRKGRIEIANQVGDPVPYPQDPMKISFLALRKKEIAHDHFNPSAYYEAGLAHLELEQYKQAIENFNRAVRLDPNYEVAYKSRADALRELKKFGEALIDYGRAIDLDPEYKNAYFNRGRTNSDLEQYEKGIDDFSKYLELDPTNARALVWRAFLFERMRDYQSEIRDCTKAIALKPDYAMAYNNRGFAFGTLGQLEKAIEDLSKAIELDRFCDLAYANRGAFLRKMAVESIDEAQKKSLLEKAVSDFTWSIERFNLTNKTWTFGMRAQCFEDLELFQQALEDTFVSLRFAEKENCSAQTWIWIIWIRLRAQRQLKHFDKIIYECTQYIENEKHASTGFTGRAWAYEQQEKHESALADYSKALELDPTNQQAIFGKARANFKVNFEQKLFEA